MHIFLWRHAESVANLNAQLYDTLGDGPVPITEWGYEQQAKPAATFIKACCDAHPELKGRKIHMVCSPFLRAQQTKKALVEALGEERIASQREDARLQEQNMGVARRFLLPRRSDDLIYDQYHEDYMRYRQHCEQGDKFTATPPLGESLAEVAARVGPCMDAVLQDYNADDIVVIVGHKQSIHAAEMHVLHQDAAWFDAHPKPANCDVILLEGNRETGFTASHFHQGKKRPPALPKDYKVAAYGQGLAIT